MKSKNVKIEKIALQLLIEANYVHTMPKFKTACVLLSSYIEISESSYKTTQNGILYIFPPKL